MLFLMTLQHIADIQKGYYPPITVSAQDMPNLTYLVSSKFEAFQYCQGTTEYFLPQLSQLIECSQSGHRYMIVFNKLEGQNLSYSSTKDEMCTAQLYKSRRKRDNIYVCSTARKE